MSSYSHTQSRVLQWLGIILIMAVFASAYWYFQVYAGYKTNVSPTGALTSGLVGYWTFDGADVSGTTATDRSGNSNTGTLTSGPSITQGKLGQALSFDANDDYVNAGSGASLDDLAALTVSAWIKPSSAGENSQGTVVVKATTYQPSVGGWALSMRSATAIDFVADFSTTDLERKSNAGTIPYNQWSHVVATWDGTATAANMHIYVNGVEVTYATSTDGVGSHRSDATYSLGIGGENASGATIFDGVIDEVRVYSRVLSVAEAQSLYKLGASDPINSGASQAQGGSRLDSGLAGYWAMDNGSGTSVTDSSTNGNTGTLTGGSSWGTGQIGSAVDLDGTDDYVDMGDLFYSDAFTVCAWVRADVIDANTRNIVLKRNTPGVSAGSNEWTLNASTSGFTFTTWTSASVTALNITGSTVPSTATWYHVCGVEHGNGRTGYIYLNGTQNASGTQTAALWDTADRVQIGARSAANDNRYWNGLVDEVRVYNRGLSADEVADLYRLATPTAVDTGLKGYWSFNGKDVSGTTAYDRSGAGNTGTLTNSPTVTPGKVGQALSFNGSNQRVTMSTPVTAAPLTITAWIKPSTLSSGVPVAILDNASTWNGFYISLSSGNINCHSASNNVFSTSSMTGTVSEWQFVSCVMASTTSRTVYVNGVAGTTNTTSSSPAATPDNLSVGAAVRDTADNFFAGSVDEVRVYNVALTAAQIQALYKQGQSDEVNTGASQAQGGSRLDSGLAGYWKLDENTGTSTSDASTNAATGTLTGGPAWTTGQIGSAVDFDGTDDYITSASFPTISAPYSYSAWIKLDALPGASEWEVIAKNSTTRNFGVLNNKLVGWNGGSNPSIGGTTLSTSTWYHIINTDDGTTNRVYLNGVLDGSVTSTAGADSAGALSIGSMGAARYFNGSVDEARIYNRTLSVEEVGQLYRLTSPTGTDTGLKGYWSFNGKDVSGTTAYDRSGAGNTGTLTSGPTVTPGKIGQALSFDGTDDYVAIAHSNSLALVGDMTIAVWMKVTDFSGYRGILGKTASSVPAPYDFYLQISNGLPYLYRGNGTTYAAVAGTVAPATGIWQHVVVTMSGTTVTHYLNGATNGSGTLSTTTTDTSQAVRIGSRNDGGTMMKGGLDEVRIYNRAFTESEIVALYNAGK